MIIEGKTREKLAGEACELRKRIAEQEPAAIERRRVEDALRESEDKFRDLAEKSFLGVYVVQDGMARYVNPRLAEMLGYKVDEIMDQKQIRELVFPEDWPTVEENVRKVLSAEVNSLGYESRMMTSSREAVCVDIYSSRTVYQGREAVLGTLLDITERRRSEGALPESEEMYRTMVEQSNDVIWTLDREGNLTFFNKRAEEISGYRLEDWRGRNFSPLVAEEDLPHVTEGLQRTLSGEPQQHYEVRAKKSDGEILVLSVNSAPIFRGREVVGVICFGRDITKLKQAQEELEKSAKEWQQTFDAALDIIALISPEFKLLKVNRAGCESLGKTQEELIGRKCYEVVHGLDHPIDGCPCAKMVETKIAGSGEISDHERYYIATASPVLNENGGLAAFTHTIKDITESKKVAQALQDTLEKLRKTLGATIEVIALTVETKDPYTAGHQQRVANLARAIAQEMCLSKDQVDGIRMAGLIHDIGKIAVPGEILSRPGKLNDIEMALVRNHAQVGYDILKAIEFPWPIAQIILQHHERMDGSGYPAGLSGEEILLEARILAVADVVEAMASHRPYRPALGTHNALEEISKYKGMLYDSNVVDTCLRLFAEKGFEFEEVKEAILT